VILTLPSVTLCHLEWEGGTQLFLVSGFWRSPQITGGEGRREMKTAVGSPLH
jgi:hypothetical protein